MIENIDLNLIIDKNQIQDRSSIEIDESIIQLSKSIKERGLLHPIIVKKIEGDKYQVVCGQRRIFAHRLIGKATIKAIVKEFNSDIDELMSILDENIQRKKLNKFDKFLFEMKILYLLNLSKQNLSFENIDKTKLNEDSINYIKKINNVRYKKYYSNDNSGQESDFEKFKKDCEILNIQYSQFFNNFFLLNCDSQIVDLIKINKINIQTAFKLHTVFSKDFFKTLIEYINSKEKVKTTDIEKLIKDLSVKKITNNGFDTNKLIENIRKVTSKKQILFLQKINTKLEKLIQTEQIKGQK